MIQPKTKQELITLINNGTDLSTVDTVLITDMSDIFSQKTPTGISNWNTSNVTIMDRMFWGSTFNEDISLWNTSKLISTDSMFEHSKFNQDISTWDISKVVNCTSMFHGAAFNKDLNNWVPSSLLRAPNMFAESSYSFDIHNWSLSIDCDITNIFDDLMRLTPFQRMVLGDKLQTLAIANVPYYNMDSSNKLYQYLKNGYIAIRKSYTYKRYKTSVTIPLVVLNKLTSTSYTPNFISEDVDFYYFKHVRGNIPTSSEVTPLIKQIHTDFSAEWFSIVPTSTETEKFQKVTVPVAGTTTGATTTKIMIIDIEFAVYKYIKTVLI